MTGPLRHATVCACGDHAFVPLTKGFVALIDPEFAPLVGQWQWHARWSRGASWYARRTINLRDSSGKRVKYSIYLHRLICPAPDGVLVDHINRDTLNNRRANLRVVSVTGNTLNRAKRRGTLSQYRGVTLTGKRWSATITSGGKQTYLGSFPSEVEAAEAYDEAAMRLHGDEATLNFPERIAA